MEQTVSQAGIKEQEICRDTLLEKYAKGNEVSVDEVRRRVARALAQAEPEEQRAHWERHFLQAQLPNLDGMAVCVVVGDHVRAQAASDLGART